MNCPLLLLETIGNVVCIKIDDVLEILDEFTAGIILTDYDHSFICQRMYSIVKSVFGVCCKDYGKGFISLDND